MKNQFRGLKNEIKLEDLMSKLMVEIPYLEWRGNVTIYTFNIVKVLEKSFCVITLNSTHSYVYTYVCMSIFLTCEYGIFSHK